MSARTWMSAAAVCTMQQFSIFLCEDKPLILSLKQRRFAPQGKDNMALNIAIYGYDSDIGRLILEVMEERGFTVNQLYPLSPLSGEYDAVTLNGRNFMVSAVDDFDFAQADAAFFITTRDETLRLHEKARNAGCIVIDNSRLFAGTGSVPTILPELNPYVIKQGIEKRMIMPTASVSTELALPLTALHDEFGLVRVSAVALESVSEHGRAGTEALAHETVQLLNGIPADAHDFEAQLAFNLHPRIGPALADGRTEHEQVILQELQSLIEELPADFSLTCLQAPVFYGHTVLLHAECAEDLDPEAVRECLQAAAGIELCADDELITPVTHGVRDNKIYLSRLRFNKAAPRALDLVIVMDNTRRGEAVNCVQCAELISSELA